MTQQISTARAHIVIPTLRGPARLVSLIEERGDHRSMVTLAETSQSAGIGAAYHSFVDHSTGVVHRLFPKTGEVFYRAEVAEPVEAGQSFELPMLVAHALREDRGRLAALGAVGERPEDLEAAPVLVWATGKIAPVTYEIGAVADVGMKLRASYALFEEALAKGQQLHLFAPAGNSADIEPDVAGWLRQRGLEVRIVRWVDEVFEALCLPPIPRASSQQQSGWKGNPYRGLEPFEGAHRAVFFGRARAREGTLELLRTAAAHGVPFLLVHGQSGVGKSSLVQAGLAGDVAEQAREGGTFRTAVISPAMGGNHPAAALWRGLAEIAGQPQPETPSAPEDLRAAIDAILETLATQHSLDPSRRTGLLVIDQLEEVFDAAITPAESHIFAASLEAIVRGGAVWVIATLRSDAVGQLDRLPELARLASSSRVYRLDRPTPYELAEIIAAPAAVAGCPFPDRTVVEDLAAVASASPDSLPLLQALLYRFFDFAGASGELNAENLKRIGGFEGAVSRWADEVRERVVADGASPQLLDRVLVSLIRIDTETGRPLARSTAYVASSAEARILDPLIAARLVSINAGVAGPQAKLAHEALATRWDYLDQLVKRLGPALSLRDELEGRAEHWHTHGRDPAELLRSGTRLDLAQQFVAEQLVPVPDTINAYVAASLDVEADDRQRSERLALAETELVRVEAEQRAKEAETRAAADRRRARSALLALAIAAVFFIGLGSATYSIYQSQLEANDARTVAERERANAEKAASQAEAQRISAIGNEYRALSVLSDIQTRDDRPTDALKLALAAWPRTEDSRVPRFTATLEKVGNVLSRRVPLLEINDVVDSATFTSDESRLLVRFHSGKLKLFDAQSTQQIGATMDHGEGNFIYGTRFNSDETRVLAWSDDNVMRQWDLATGTMIGKPMPIGSEYARAGDFSADGRYILSVSAENVAQLWNAETTEPLGKPIRYDSLAGGRFIGETGRFALWTFGGDLDLWQAGDQPTKVPSHSFNFDAFSQVSKDGSKLLAVAYRPDSQIHMWDLVKSTDAMPPIAAPDCAGLREGKLRFTPDEGQIVCVGDSGVAVWDVASGRASGPHIAFPDIVDTAVSGDGRALVAWSSSGKLQPFGIASGKPLGPEIEGGKGVVGALLDHDAKTIIAWRDNGDIVFWDVHSGIQTELYVYHRDDTRGVALSRDGARLASWAGNGTFRLWDLTRGAQLVLQADADGIGGALALERANRIATWSRDGVLRLWDSTTGRLVWERNAHPEGYSMEAALISDQSKILTWSNDDVARLWDVATGIEIGQPVQLPDLQEARANATGTRIVVWSDEGSMRLWNVEAQHEVAKAELGPFGPVGDEMAFVGDTLLAWNEFSAISRWSATSGQRDSDLGESVYGVLSDSDRTRLFAWGANGNIQMFDAATSAAIGQTMRHSPPEDVLYVALDSNETVLLSYSRGGTARLWDVATQTPLGEPIPFGRPINGIGFSPDGSRAVLWGLGGAVVAEVPSGRIVGRIVLSASDPRFHDPMIREALLTRDNQRLLVSIANQALLYDVQSGQPMAQTMWHTREVSSIRFLDDEDRIMTTTGSAVKIWNADYPSGNIIQVACATLGDKSLGAMEARYGIDIADPICTSEQLALAIDSNQLTLAP